MVAFAHEVTPSYFFRSMVILLLALAFGFLIMEFVTGDEPKPPKDPPPITIVSPWQGTFYAREYEGGKPFVAVGSKVQPLTIVCIIEGMKQFRIPAGVEATVIEVLAKDNELVVPGQPLFKVQPVRPPGKPWDQR